MKFAIIPARGGSKRIPRKNIKPFFGQPMIAWSIKAAISSGCFDRVIVSTDDSEIAQIARDYGAETPFVRPVDLSDDYTASTEVVRHAVEWLFINGFDVEAACCIYATAPFITPELIQQSYVSMISQKKSYAFTVVSYDYPVQRAITLDENGNIEMLYPEYRDTRSQDLKEAWHDAGQLYWGLGEAWMERRPIFSQYSAPVVIPRYLAQDIDTEEDWRQAERLYQL
ncbi:N-acylneuraminate cytidylyltransferase [Oceanospirillum multiglobuliferum]|uniref:Pseudaminic acid cytidylyltransferase n=1 Tax=Oceanospirillum multiglobuliferum TaxID=64969 RepID=A0A1T4L2R4_9GAMM|nr:pseudaminic acid cytidylyltransferase [Oceanospirillum multiglobuliferum]OPX56824.1 pseudaminic acid cytidylyltransferase [Oceanospirillum multiglobuliferum]SJZ49042.1 N-acylneuraminate cytidylyltransferase [Oceanospirillum multiglobuliferum]